MMMSEGSRTHEAMRRLQDPKPFVVATCDGTPRSGGRWTLRPCGWHLEYKGNDDLVRDTEDVNAFVSRWTASNTKNSGCPVCGGLTRASAFTDKATWERFRAQGGDG